MKPSIFAAFLRAVRSGGRRNAAECIRLCAEAGFKAVDYSPDYYDEDWRKEASDAADAAEEYGVCITQTHAPYNFYRKDPLDRYRELLFRSVEGARILGAKDLVFHFDEYHPPVGMPFDAETGLKRAMETLSDVIEKTVASGINAALENTFEDHHRVGPDERSHLCSEITELETAISLFKDEHVTCCWDFGHAHLQFGDKQADMIRRMGKRISCTHVHDNYYNKDLHLMPFYGQLDWETLIPALSETGYDGTLAFEAGYGRFPEELLAEFLKLSKHALDLLCAFSAN